MLEELVVRDYALIDRLSVTFDRGLNILTGETGAGKSIIIGALGFLLGGKADVDSIRAGKEEALVSAVVTIDERNIDALAWLRARDIVADEGRVIMRRSLKRSGRSNAYIQETPVVRGELAEFSSFLFDIHGQHEHQALLKPESHRLYLDRFAGIEDEVASFTAAFFSLAEKRKSLQDAVEAERGRGDRMELLRFAVDENGNANVVRSSGPQLAGPGRARTWRR